MRGQPAVLGREPDGRRAARQPTGSASPARSSSEAHVTHRFVATEPHGGTIGRRARGRGSTPARASSSTWAATARSPRSRRACSAAEHAGDVAMGMLPTGTANDQGGASACTSARRSRPQRRGGSRRARRCRLRCRARSRSSAAAADPPRSVLRLVQRWASARRRLETRNRDRELGSARSPGSVRCTAIRWSTGGRRAQSGSRRATWSTSSSSSRR